MSRTLTIDPVTRIEGHGKITLHLDDSGEVADARFHVTQFRGFEKFVEGRPFWEMPSIMARTCGICPVSHLIASAKACDELLAVKIPRTAMDLRRVMNLAQFMQSHALSFFYLSSPDLLMGFDSDPATRNVFGVASQRPELARDGVRLRQIGQKVIERLGGKRIHPAWVVPGGVSEPLTSEVRDELLAMMPDALAIARRTLKWFKSVVEDYRQEIRTFGNYPSHFLSLVASGNLEADRGDLATYEGLLRVTDASGKMVVEGMDPRRYADLIEEHVEPDSYLKSPYLRDLGFPDGHYRVGPLARLNNVDKVGTPEADEEWAEYRELHRGAVLSSFHYHYARLIEILFCAEKMEQLLKAPHILDPHVRAVAEPNQHEGVGVSEAPRGTLMHHYRIDDNGLVTWANMIIATGHNNLAMNKSVLEVARHFVKSAQLQEGMLNRVEAVVRTYDPCLSCSTHAVGQMPLDVQLLDPQGRLLDRIVRD